MIDEANSLTNNSPMITTFVLIDGSYADYSGTIQTFLLTYHAPRISLYCSFDIALKNS